MLRRYAAVVLLSILVLSPNAGLAQQATQNAPAVTIIQSADPIDRIKDEGMNRSQVMKTLSYLTDVIGPRLTNSPNMKRANEWTRDEMTRWGLQNAHLEPWGPFGRGWSLKRFSAQVTEPQSIPLIAFPKAWSPSTNGTLTGDVVYLNANDEAELDQFKGKLKGAIVLTSGMREVKARFEAMSTRRDEKDLLSLADAPEPRGAQRRMFQMSPEQRAAMMFGAKKNQFLFDEGAAVLIDPSRIGDGGTIFVQSASVPQPFPTGPIGPNTRGVSPYDKSAPKLTPQLVMAVEHYNRLVRMIEAGEKVKMAVDLAVEFHDADLMGYNTIAEIPGSDLKDEIVMLGGHMDSWHAGTGATDNGAGVAVGMEAMRIIQTLGLKPRRTIRIALWSGEEQGLLGSRAYVAEHFGKMEAPTAPAGAGNGNGGATATPAAPVLVTKPAYEKLSAYFNLDNGTGKIRGVYLQGNEGVRPLFRQWLMAFRDRPEDKTSWGASTLSISNTGGTDHLAFDAIGLPGFQFIQDEIEYDTRTHHSNQDVFDRIQGDDMKQAATIMAAFVYNTAMLDQKLPRKPMPGR
ncbi:MAG: M20/M25/M40 family metallo-hydrolase [Acidobacteriota bacterium]|nr:M20/M25/M40 family metallo-hydrolase [Acidobacteriota bacterium]